MDEKLAARLALLTQAQRSFVLGVLGASLLRDWHIGGDDQADRLAELFAVVRVLDTRRGDDTLPVEVSAREGYSEWASTYDGPNPMIEAEESLVHALLAPSLRPDAVVLDAACGTGRHTEWIAGEGCRTIGIDLTAAMLRRASVAAPHAHLLQGDIRRLPLASGSVDAAICSLALCHLPDLEPALVELARVLRPRGRLVVSDPHGRAAYAGGQGFFGEGGLARPRFVRNYHRQAAEWMEAFSTSGFDVESCHEPRMGAATIAAHPVARDFFQATFAAFNDVPHLWIWSAIRNDE